MAQTKTIFVENLHTALFAQAEKIFVLADENTARLCLPEIEKRNPVHTITIPAGEQHKNIHTLTHIWQELTSNFADRNSVLVNIGGGVICDLGGFAASTYMRGIPFIHVPTSLLAMADAAHGGKTGIDLLNFKNMIGTFANANTVYIYPEFLNTLPKRELQSGFAEVVKHYIIADATAFHEMWKSKLSFENNIDWKPTLQKAIHIKQSIVEQDPFENNIRKILNFGHTAGHAIESYFLNQKNFLLHGEAVAIGMLIEIFIAEELKIIEAESAQKITELLEYIFNNRPEIKEIETVIDLVKHDKKNSNTTPLFSLPNRIGNCLFNYEVPESTILNALKNYNEHFATS